MLQGNQQLIKQLNNMCLNSSECFTELVQNDMNTLPQLPQAKSLLVLELEEAEVAIEVEAEVE